MSYDANVRDIFETLPSEEQVEVIDSMLFLKKRRENQSMGVKNMDHVFPFDCFAGGLGYISDDFDEPLADFEEYM